MYCCAAMSDGDESKRQSEGGTCDEYGFRIAEEHVDAYKKHCVAQAAKRQVACVRACVRASCVHI